MSIPHLTSVLDVTLQQGSQTQTPLGAMLSEAWPKTIGTDGNLELENACLAILNVLHLHSKKFFLFAFSVLFKNKTNKKDIVPSKTHLWARTSQLAVSERVINKSKDVQRSVDMKWFTTVWCVKQLNESGCFNLKKSSS